MEAVDLQEVEIEEVQDDACWTFIFGGSIRGSGGGFLGGGFGGGGGFWRGAGRGFSLNMYISTRHELCFYYMEFMYIYSRYDYKSSLNCKWVAHSNKV